MQIVFVTRYSYVGRSGWRSKASRDPSRLLNPDRLAYRARLFEGMPLASLKAQTDQNFKLLVLSSDAMAQEDQDHLNTLCGNALGDRAHVIYRHPDFAGRQMRKYLRRNLKGPSYTVQIVLDDDDALSTDFVETVRQEARALLPTLRGRGDAENYTYLSYPEGVTAFFGADRTDYFQRSVPFTNLGLSLVARTKSRRNPYLIDHKNVARDHPTRVMYHRKPYYVRAVHELNDSAPKLNDAALSDDELLDLYRRFPALRTMSKLRSDLASLRQPRRRAACTC